MLHWLNNQLDIVKFFKLHRESLIKIGIVFGVLIGIKLIYHTLPEGNLLSELDDNVEYYSNSNSNSNSNSKYKSNSNKKLVVLLHAFNNDGSNMADVRDTLLSTVKFDGADIYQPDLPFGAFSLAEPEKVTAELLFQIDQLWERAEQDGKPYDDILLVGHSMGAIYARKIYVAAHGKIEAAPFENKIEKQLLALGAKGLKHQRKWAPKIKNIVLLAALNRGWSISHHMSLLKAVEMQLGVAMGYALEFYLGKPPIIFSVRRGAPFITQLRLQWLALQQHAKNTNFKLATTVQLLGTIDDLVSPYDNIDLITGNDFYYIDVPYSSHENVVDMLDGEEGSYRIKNDNCNSAETNDNVKLIRRCKLKAAIDKELIIQEDTTLSDQRLVVDNDVTDLLFVIHGIRDEGFWTQKIARRIIKKAKEDSTGRVIAMETSSYGYFPMLSFLKPGARQEKVEWLMDRYTLAKAQYPNARFHYIGHSHGTYLLAKAMQDYAAVRFCNVVFAGSVVRRDYGWSQYIESGQAGAKHECDEPNFKDGSDVRRSRINRITNFVATTDWVVAFFPKALQSIGVQDLGSAGHDGFDDSKVIELKDNRYIVGGHSAAIDETMWDSIADFVLYGELKNIPSDKISEQQNLFIKILGYFPILVWAVIVLVLFYGAKLIIGFKIREWKKTSFLIGYFSMIYVVLSSL